jgi:dUTP pyrophosphatase
MENTETLKVKFKKLSEEAEVPSYAHNGDVGMDFRAIGVEYDEAHDLYIYHTGLAFESDFNVGQFLFARSSNRKTDAYLCNGVGIADSAIYRGEILFCYKNRTSLQTMIVNRWVEEHDWAEAHEMNGCCDYWLSCIKKDLLEKAKNLEFAPYKVGDYVGQMVFFEYKNVELIEVDELSDSERGADGFGSTDKMRKEKLITNQ